MLTDLMKRLQNIQTVGERTSRMDRSLLRTLHQRVLIRRKRLEWVESSLEKERGVYSLLMAVDPLRSRSYYSLNSASPPLAKTNRWGSEVTNQPLGRGTRLRTSVRSLHFSGHPRHSPTQALES